MEKNISIEEKLNKRMEWTFLYDFYGELLKDNQKTVFEDYILNDLSLGEIAQEQGISRQGVYDLVRRCCRQLESYEERLRLAARFRRVKDQVIKIRDLSRSLKLTGDCSAAEEIEQTAADILEEL